MSDSLRLRASFDDDGTAELFAEVSANGFCGRGSAWFNVSQLSVFALELGQRFPLSSTLEIAGGYWSPSAKGTLDQEHLAIAFYPVGGLGTVGCQVRLASQLLPEQRPASQNSVRVEMFTSYHEVARFSASLLKLSFGEVDEAILTAVAG